MKKYKLIFITILTLGLSSCSDYLDIVPDNVATIDNAFTLRSTAERYLFTCYSYLPNEGSISYSPSLLGSEIWPLYAFTGDSGDFVRGEQGVVSPILNYWDGLNGAADLYEAIRNCNIFLENIYSVPDMEESEILKWEAEVKFLKGYYHFLLMRMYGPIPVIRENQPIDSDLDEVRVSREPIDDVVNYIVQLLDEASPYLPPYITDEGNELGRITQPIALSVKAQVLVTAASPLFNGNPDYANLVDPNYGPLFNPTEDPEKWKLAMDAAKAAIDVCHEVGMGLFRFQTGVGGQIISDATTTQLSIRNAITEKFNPEIIWSFTGAVATQTSLTPRTWDPDNNHDAMQGRYGPPINFVEMFYTENGVPIDEDKEWNYEDRYDLKRATEADKYNIHEGYETVAMHFNREDRFYASTGFDGGIWYGQGKFDDNDTWHLEGRANGYTARAAADRFTPTGYWPKKLINYLNVVGTSSYSVVSYYWPNLRLADLYLLYAEAANEYLGPNEESYEYINSIRDRAGLPTVQNAWTAYSTNPSKFENKEGLREIIHQERQIELAYEAKRYWDLLRWKKAQTILSEPTMGWNLTEEAPESFYRKTLVFDRTFNQRDYLQPIREYNLLRNPNLIQNPGW